MNKRQSGAEISVRSGKPCLDIATLVSLIASVISSSQNSSPNCPNVKQRRVLEFDSEKKRLKICTSAVLFRLFENKEFLKQFDPEQASGFIQNLSMPSYGNQSRIGGYIDKSNEVKLPTSVEQLVTAIDATIDTVLPENIELSCLLLEDPNRQLKQLAKKVNVTFKEKDNTASIIPLIFDRDTNKSPSSAVAKVISAVETIEADDYFERMCHAIDQHLRYERDVDEEDSEAARDSLEAERNSPDSQIVRFLTFLDNEALSRVRLQITFQIMKAVADNASKNNESGHQLLAEYVNRVINLVEAIKVNNCIVDLSNHYGTAFAFELSEYVSRVNFFFCLPVWSDWRTQLGERKGKGLTDKSYAVSREVSYRFRVNGKNPELNKPAFAARLDKIEEGLLDEKVVNSNPKGFNRRLAELIFLAVVTPSRDVQLLTSKSLFDEVQALCTNLKTSGKVAIAETIADLRRRAEVMEAVAAALISVLRTKGRNIVSQLHHGSYQQFICVKRSIVEWTRLEGADSGAKDLLVRSEYRSREQIEWFKHIEINDRPEALGLLFSVQVTTKLSEHNLTKKGEAEHIRLERLLPKKILQICWVPYTSKVEKDGRKYQSLDDTINAENWVLPASIHVEYDPQLLARRSKEKDNSKHKHYHAATVTAFLILVYCYVWCITRKLKQTDSIENDFTTLMLRLQQTGKAADEEGSGEDYIYATAQSIESLLAQDIDVRMQGIGLENLKAHNSSLRYVKSGTFNALLSAFPIAINSPQVSPEIANIGLISYATRFCDDSPGINSNERGYLLVTQSYIASAIEQPLLGYELKKSRRRSDIIDSPAGLSKQRLVQEEIGYLRSLGCQHIILLSHFYGDRHFNRSADYNSSLSSKEFLEEISQTFPDLTIYTMLRDVFPTTRLRSRQYNEAAFEILRAEDFTKFSNSEISSMRDLIPIYAFATLYAIEESSRPQSGFCTYFLVSDLRVNNINWSERPRQQLIDPEHDSTIRPCIIAVLRGLHFIEAERGANSSGQLQPVLDPFSWISPTTVESAGEVQVFHNRRQGKLLISCPAVLTNIAAVLRRKK